MHRSALNPPNTFFHAAPVKSLWIFFIFVLLVLCVHNSEAASQDDAERRELTVDALARAAIVDTISVMLRELYVFPDIAEDMVKHVRGQLQKGTYDDIKTLGAFVHALTKDLLSVYPDGHLQVDVLEESQQVDSQTFRDDWWEKHVEDAQHKNFNFRQVELLPGNVGYLELTRFEYPELAAETANAAMHFLSYSDALIIDLRQNPGGRGELSQLILSYLFEDHRVHYATTYDRAKGIEKQWWTLPRGSERRMPDIPVYVLTSKATGSAAEEFAYALKHLERATVVGDTTAGAAHTTHRHEFNDLHVKISIPDGTNICPVTGEDWEGVGVIPHISVPPDEALQAAHLDALETLLEGQTDEGRRFRLDWAKRQLDATIHPVELSRKAMKQYVGTYGPRQITLESETLVYQREGRSKHRLVPLGDDLFMLDGLDYFRIQFARDDSGGVSELIGIMDDGSRSSNSKTP